MKKEIRWFCKTDMNGRKTKKKRTRRGSSSVELRKKETDK